MGLAFWIVTGPLSSTVGGYFLVPFVVGLTPFVSLLLVAILKWLVVGRLKPGRYRLWSTPMLQWWFAQMLLAPLEALFTPFHGTPVFNLMLRALCAKVELDAVLNGPVVFDPDLLSVGSQVHVGFDARLMGHHFEAGGILILGKVRIMGGAFLGPRAMTQPFTTIGPGAHLGSLSVLEIGTTIQHGEVWSPLPLRLFFYLARFCARSAGLLEW